MLDNLVESRNNSHAVRKLYGFLISTFFVIAAILLSATVWSLFAKDFGMGSDNMELSTLLAPIPAADEVPKPEPQKTQKQNQPQTAKTELPNRQNIIARIDEPQIVPAAVSVAPSTQKSRPVGAFTNNRNAVETDGCQGCNNDRADNKDGGGTTTKFAKPETTVVDSPKLKELKPPPAFKKTEEEKPKKNTTVTLGVINGKATSLPKPPYPPPAQAVNATGAVNVQVTIDEQGKVISAKAVSGHPLLRQAAENAARNAKFTPTLLSNVPVKVNGLIVYNFTK